MGDTPSIAPLHQDCQDAIASQLACMESADSDGLCVRRTACTSGMHAGVHTCYRRNALSGVKSYGAAVRDLRNTICGTDVDVDQGALARYQLGQHHN